MPHRRPRRSHQGLPLRRHQLGFLAPIHGDHEADGVTLVRELADCGALGSLAWQARRDARLVEDTTGQGHTTRQVGNEPCVTATIPLANQ